MSLQFKCSKCGSLITVKHLNPGDTAVCRKCGTENAIPSSAIKTDQEADYVTMQDQPIPASERITSIEPKKGGLWWLLTTPVDKLFVQSEAKHAAPVIEKRPGVIIPSVLGPKGYWDVLREIATIYRTHFLKMLFIVGIVDIIWFSPILIADAFGLAEPQNEASAFMFLISLIFIFLSAIGYPLMQCALIYAISEHFLHRTISIKNAFKFAIPKLGAPIGAMVIASVCIFVLIMIIIGIPAALLLWIMWLFVFQVTLIEGLSSTKALGRSYALVKNSWWRLFGTMIVLVMAMVVSSFVLEYVPYIGPFLSYVLIPPVYIIGTTILYFDQRVRKEGYTPEQLAQELNIPTYHER